MTNTQAIAITTPATGLQLYDTTNNKNLLYNGTLWQNIATETWVAAQGYLTTAPTLASVTTAGNTTTNSISTGNITASASNIASLTLVDTLQPYAWSFRNNGTNLLFVNNGGTNVLRINASGNVLVGTNTDAGFKLDVNGTARVQGNLTITGSSLTVPFLNGGIDWTAGQGSIKQNSGTITYTAAHQSVFTNINNGSDFLTGSRFLHTITGTFAPPSGTATYVASRISPTINQTGGANGITRGLFIDPTITAAADFRAIETTVGNILLVTTSGDVAIGTSTLATATKLTLGGSETAISAIARGQLINTTLVAAANNDVLVGLDINPTFTNGAFTGVTNLAARIQGNIQFYTNASAKWTLNNSGGNGLDFGADVATAIYLRNTISSVGLKAGSGTDGTSRIIVNTDGSQWILGSLGLVIGGSTNAGYKLDVNGTFRYTGGGFFQGGTNTPVSIGTYMMTYVSSTTSYIHAYSNTSYAPLVFRASTLSFYSGQGSYGQWGLDNTGMNLYDAVSGVTNHQWARDGVARSSGTTPYAAYTISPVINNTGTYSGIVRGIYYNPTLTSLTGTTHRAIETVTGDVLLATTSGTVVAGGTTVVNMNYGQVPKLYVSTGAFLDGIVQLPTTLRIMASGGGINFQQQSAPSTNSLLTFGNDSNGVYYGNFLSLGLRFLVSNVAQMTIASTTGNVLINTTTDAGYKLDVAGSARVQTNLNVGDTAFTATTPNYISLGGTYANSGYGAKLKLLDSGSTQWGLGISTAGINYYGSFHNFFAGTTTAAIVISPSADTASTGPAYISIGQSYSSVAGANPKLRLFGTTYGLGVSAGQVDYIAPSHVFYANGTEAMRITSAGYIGIGTTTPTDIFHIVNNTNGNKFGRISAGGSDASAAWVAQNDQVDNVVYRVFGSGVSGSQMGIALARSASLIANLGGSGKFLIGTYSATDLVFGAGDQERMRLVNNTGNFLIGTTVDSGYKLNVSGSVNIVNNLIVGGNLTTSPTYTNCGLLSPIGVAENTTETIGFAAKIDPNGWWNPGTKRWTPTVPGFYFVTLQVRWDIGTLGNQINIQILKNLATVGIAQDLLPTNTGLTQTTSAIIEMNGSTDYVTFTGYTSSTTGEFIHGEPQGNWTFFNAFKIN